MSISITSTTDSIEAVNAALGDLAKGEGKDEKTSATTEKSDDETKDESETSDGSEEAEAEVDASKDDDEAEESEEDPAKDGEKKKKNKGVKKRIDKLNLRNAETERRAIIAEERIRLLEEQSSKSQAAPKQTYIDNTKAPNPNDFTSNADYQAALVDFKVEAKLQEREERARVAQVKSEQAKQSQSFAEKLTEFAATRDDYDEVLDEVKHVPLSDFFRDQIKTSELGPELVYLLGKHPSDYERLAKLEPVQLLRELGKFEARFSKSDSPKSDSNKTEIKKSKAPPPINPVKAKGSGVSKSLDEMDYQEFVKAREPQRAQR